MSDAPQTGFSDAELLAELPGVRRYARALTRNAAAADDLEQDTVMRALAKRNLYQPGTSFRSWLFTICHNTHVNQALRGIRGGDHVELNEANGGASLPDVYAKLELRDVARAARSLDVGLQRVMAMTAQGFSYEQIAATLDLPIGTVRSRIFLSREALRRVAASPSSRSNHTMSGSSWAPCSKRERTASRGGSDPQGRFLAGQTWRESGQRGAKIPVITMPGEGG